MARIVVLGASDIQELLDPDGCRAAMERAFVALAEDEVFVPLRPMIRPPQASNLLALMPTFRAGARPLYGLKAIAIVTDNPSRGLDPHQGTVSIFDGVTGETLAVLNGAVITAIRTAAVSALATDLLARQESRVLAVVGAGHQAEAHLTALSRVRPFEEIRITSRTHTRAAALAERHPLARAIESVEAAVKGADVIATVTSSSEPVLSREWLAPGTHINAVGSSFATKRELDSGTMAAATLVVDRRESAENESGDYLIALDEGAIGPDHIRAELGDILTGKHPGRTSDQEITVFKSLGLAIQDLYAAEYVLERAQEMGRGTSIDF